MTVRGVIEKLFGNSDIYQYLRVDGGTTRKIWRSEVLMDLFEIYWGKLMECSVKFKDFWSRVRYIRSVGMLKYTN